MRIRRWVALSATASIAFWTPSVAPVKADPIACSTILGSSCPVPLSAHASSPSPWPAVVVIVGVVGVMTNAAWVWHTQCRELSSQEAMTSTFLPFVGMAFDAHASKCR